jgi:hypothetical protein
VNPQNPLNVVATSRRRRGSSRRRWWHRRRSRGVRSGKKLFHRGVILGTFDTGRAGADVDGVTLTVRGREKEYADHVDPLIPVGKLGDVACHVANVVAQMGETDAAGDIVITGSGDPDGRRGPHGGRAPQPWDDFADGRRLASRCRGPASAVVRPVRQSRG